MDSRGVMDSQEVLNRQEGMDNRVTDPPWGSKGGMEHLKVDTEGLRALMGLHRTLGGSRHTSRDPLSSSSRGMGVSREGYTACTARMAGCTPRGIRRL